MAEVSAAMNVLEKAEKALEYLKNVEGSAKSHELQAATQTLGRCLGALGSRHNCAKHYANLLHAALPVMLSLASNSSAEIRLIGDEALNRAVVGGFAFHSYKTNVLLQNQIDHTKNARWIRAALSRICLGDCWLRPGVGKIRSQAQTLFPKLTQIVKQTDDIQLILDALENNLPRILPALADYTTDEEICDLSKALLTHIESPEAAVRRGVASCVAHLVAHRELLLSNVLGKVFESLWPPSSDNITILGWFGVIKSIFQINDIRKFSENDIFGVQDYLELYHLCIHYLEISKDHNIQNAVMECLTILLGQGKGPYSRALLDSHPKGVNLDNVNYKGHRRNISSASGVSSRFIPSPLTEPKDQPELSFSGALQLGSLLKLDTPSLSVEDLTVQTPDSPASESDLPELPVSNTDQLTQDLAEKLKEYEEDVKEDVVDHPVSDCGIKINIGSSSDEDVYLKYCARLLASKFLLTGNKGDLISDRSVRVSVKSSTLNCLSEVIHLYPQVITMYLDKDADIKCHNISGSTETDSNQDHINDFILERNVCYQDSLSNSLSQELLNRSIDSHLSEFKKDSKSLEKSQDSAEQRSSSKDAPSAVLDSKTKDLAGSGITDSTNPNMSYSNFTNITSNSNMTTSNDHTGYPMTSSGDILSSSIDLDIKFDHFGESTTNLDNLKDLELKEKTKKPLKRTDEVHSKDMPDFIEEKDEIEINSEKEFEFQHMSDIFLLLQSHNDPQIRGLVRVCIGNYLSSALDRSHGEYHRWRNYNMLPKEISEHITTEKLMDIVLKGLTDDLHSTVNHTLTSITKLAMPLSNSAHWMLLVNALNALVDVENNSYWLCRANLCKLYEKLPYDKLFTLYSGYQAKSKQIMDTLYRLLADQDQKVRNAASQAIANIIEKTYPSKRHSSTTMATEIAKEHSKRFTFDHTGLSLDLVRNIYFYYDLPSQLRTGEVFNGDSLKIVIGDIMGKVMSASCRNYSQGLLECLQTICHKWSPWKHIDEYSEQGILSYCIDNFDCCNSSVAARTVLMDLCRLVYPVEIHNIMCYKTANLDIFERDSQPPKDKWQYLDNSSVANLAEKFLQVTLKMLNVLVHLIEEVNPNTHLNRSGIALPGSPVRKKSQDQGPKKASVTTETVDDKTLRKKPASQAINLKGNLAGHFFNEPFYMKLYENLRATYSNHKINLEPKSSMFYDFLSTTLNCLAVQLEFSTEREFGAVTEEILYYLRVIMPLCPEKTVYCITQLLKCLFGTNMINQYADFMSIQDKIKVTNNASFFDDVMMVNCLDIPKEDTRRSSITSVTSQKLSLDNKNPRMISERELLIKMENFSKNRTDRKWSTNKKELERYIRLFEPVVIQALKSYTMQNDIPLQCAVLCLLNQLLTLRVNYCMLDSDQVFIGFLMKQLDWVEQHEIPNCCDLVNSILMFLVQLSSSKHHTKQLIEIPKLIQLCDGLMASGAQDECIAGLEPVAVRVFSNMGGGSVLGRAQQQEAQATREVLFYMLQKTLHQHKVLDLVACVLSLSQEHPESYYRWSELASDTLLNLLSQRSIEIDTSKAVSSLERLLDSVYKDVLLEQSRVEMVMKILFKAPPDQATTPLKLKIRYLSIIMVLLRKVIVLIPESEMLLTINYLKAAFVSPQSLFFNVKNDIDPLNVQIGNDHCAHLSPDVILVRFLFKTLTYAITELDNVDIEAGSDSDENQLLYSVCVSIIVQVKHILHLTDGCLFPLTSKTAQTILHNEQSGLNTGLYSPEENIPLDVLNLACLKYAHRLPMLTVHWSHLLIRLNFLSHKFWQKLVGFARNLPWSVSNDIHLLRADSLQTACVTAYCEYFIENGLTEVIHLTWLLVNRVHILVSQWREAIVRSLVLKVQQVGGASGLLLQAIAARCQNCLKDEFALNAYHILSLCHANQSGALVFLICRIIGKLEPALAARFAKLAVDRCRLLKELTADEITVQLSKEDVQVALELLQREKVYVRYSALVMELNALASSVFDLSPLDLSQDRSINPQHIVTTTVDRNWLTNQVKVRCCQSDCKAPKIPKQKELAQVLLNLSQEDLTTVMSCPDFDKKLLATCFKVSCDIYLREFLNAVLVVEEKEKEKEHIRQQREITRIKEEMSASTDSNKLNVVNSLHVFKKSENKESKSQFFIPITDSGIKDFGNLQISDEEIEFNLPELPQLYTVSLATFDKCLTDVIKLFPKQNRPLSQSENFDLNSELSINRYTRRCHQVFQDKLFYREFMNIQTTMIGFLETLERLIGLIDETDCDLLEKCIENIIPTNLAKNIAIFSVISLQYISFLIKNKKIVESPVHTDVSFRATVVTETVTVDNVIAVTIGNVSKALTVDEIWAELNMDSNVNRTQSAICCLYAVVKYLVKDTKPLTLQHYMQIQDDGPKPDIVIVGDKLISLVDYWEKHFYINRSDFLPTICKGSVEKLIVSLARLDIVNNIALIPPIAWSSVEVSMKNGQINKVDLPLQALQDLDVLEPFVFRVNLIGWSSKKQFEEMWVGLLTALQQGNGPHCAVRGITQLLIDASPKVRMKGKLHLPREHYHIGNAMQRLRNILVGTSAYRLFENVNLERIPLMQDGFDGYHYAQMNAEYLKLASDIIDEASYKVSQEVKRMKKSRDIDVNSCLQLLMDVAAQMLEPKAPTGLACSVALLFCIIHSSELFTQTGQWCYAAQTVISVCGPSHAHLTQYNATGRALLHALSGCLSVLDGFEGLQELSTVHQKLVKSLSSSYAPLRQAALQGCLLQLTGKSRCMATQQSMHYQQLIVPLTVAVKQYLDVNARISLYEQSLYWTVLFTLIELGHPDLINIAVDFILSHPRHYCADLVVKGITNTIRQQILPKELKKTIIEKLLDNMRNYNECHAVQILMVHLFTADNKLLSPKLTSDVSNMDPDVLMSSMERITLLYKVLRQTKSRENKEIITSALKYFLRETLPPAATLSRVVIELLESCKEGEQKSNSERKKWTERASMNAEIVFEVFETAIAQDQLPLLSGWLFEALCHLLNGKLSHTLLPYCVLSLLVSASTNQCIREIFPICLYLLKIGFSHNLDGDYFGIFKEFLKRDSVMSFSDKRLLCVVALHSDFSRSQLDRLKELCENNECLKDLLACLEV